jgi:hypothetical protein
VIWFVVIVGCLNLLLGFLLAVALTEPPPWSHWIAAQPAASGASKTSLFGKLLAILQRLTAIMPSILACLPRWDRFRRTPAVAEVGDAIDHVGRSERCFAGVDHDDNQQRGV